MSSNVLVSEHSNIRALATRRITPRNKDGFTLIELIVAVSISLIVLGVTVTILFTSMNVSSASIKTSQGEQVVNACLDFVFDQFEFAEAISPAGATGMAQLISGTDAFLFVGNASAQPSTRGHLYLRAAGEVGQVPTDVFGEHFYSGGSIALDLKYTRTLGQRPAVTATVTIYDAQGVMVARKTRSRALINGVVDTEASQGGVGTWPSGWAVDGAHEEVFSEGAVVVVIEK